MDFFSIFDRFLGSYIISSWSHKKSGVTASDKWLFVSGIIDELQKSRGLKMNYSPIW